ncbi:uncharacterized protein ACLA_036170 [Aspergillus clavatus NRRL 1]|uniref:Uncharacterized protein n=1 Tax=Aspergillus clavatus (strain ATCC 1007 / CBS 513.65 / DSM 816 / NCTC 3887 / NRRL 1 / QM 1276 / 107) TaxID=344612 RepID=A1CJU0_ASPCL|nr:uncharacterized protein ACLA_036170 [Aspergillus clavatus NRRL 1]EAW09414.1 conserved hypothetical protein [Aspergillus clavatus NRRL 1]
MLSPTTFAYSRQAPPVRPSRSLEGLEQVILPRVPRPPARPTVQLDKPLPDIPSQSLPEASMMRGSTAWSDDSSIFSSVESRRESHSESAHSTESYPVFVRSASDELADYVDPSPAVALDHSPIVGPYTTTTTASSKTILPATSYSPTLSSFQQQASSTEEQYGSPPDWVQKRSGPNHYFREKKWDFFPELATPSALGTATGQFPPASSQLRKKHGSKLNLSAFDFARNRRRSNTGDRGTLTLAHEVRDSIRSYVHRTLSKHSVDKDRPSRQGRPVTAPSFPPSKCASSQRNTASSTGSYVLAFREEPSPIDVDDRMRTLSISTSSSTSERWMESPPPAPVHRTKQLAVPITPYQKYGAAIWDKSGGVKRVSCRQNHNVRFPKYHKKNLSVSTHKSKPSADFAAAHQTSASSPPGRSATQQNTRDYIRVLQDGTTQVLDVLDGAKKRVIGSSVDRRRTALKSQIRLVGPVNPYTTHDRTDPWI